MSKISTCIVLSLLAYNCKTRMDYPNMDYSGSNKVSDTAHVVVTGESMYDTIVPPKLIIDSLKLYEKLSELLSFSRNLRYENETRLSAYFFVVGNDGKVQKSKIQNGLVETSKDIRIDMAKVMDYVSMNLINWDPAHLKKDASKKIPFDVEVSFYFYRDRILFMVQGDESFCFLKKAYNPNYLSVE